MLLGWAIEVGLTRWDAEGNVTAQAALQQWEKHCKVGQQFIWATVQGI